ncbi:MAG TPA: DUF72 domain-containing protein [Armatimonadota bacterium]|jgi:uncharacterized protein YecE (DUF72 family)
MGFSYKEWVGPFYAPGTAANQMLGRYSTAFDTVELDTTFYAPPRAAFADKWRNETPDGFTFAAKVWQRITHELRFRDVQEDLALYLNAVDRLRPKLGPLLFQCPPDLTVDALPEFSALVAALPAGYRWAVEFRHRSWFIPEVRDLLTEANVALAGVDHNDLPRYLTPTADFLYVRLLGNRSRITSIGKVVKDRAEDVQRWAAEIQEALPSVDDAWVLVNNHYSGFSPHTVALLYEALGLAPPRFPAEAPPDLGPLFRSAGAG